MDREQSRDIIHLMLSKEFQPIQERIVAQVKQKVKALVAGSDRDERNRGWIEALEWLLRMPKDIQKEIADDVKKKGEDVAPSDER